MTNKTENRTENILSLFREISLIPRQSGNRGPITDWIKNWAKEQGFSCQTDDIDNILIKVPASPGREGENPVILQGHSDMVCEKTPSSSHDFSTDPLDLYEEEGWLKARDTTLGADNGIAIAIALDLAQNNSVSHAALEILITSDEEIGLEGANALKEDFLSGKQLINIDSEDEGVLTVGCAGGIDCLFDLTGDWEEKKGPAYTLLIDGLAGGHSGVDISLGRGSAVKLAGRMLSDLSETVRLVSLNSGSGATNAISRRAECRLVGLTSANEEATLNEWVLKWQKIFRTELGEIERGLVVSIESTGSFEGRCLTRESQHRLANLVNAVPHGVMAYSREIEGLVETSTNLAFVLTKEDDFYFGTSQRSSVMSRLREINSRVEAVARLAQCGNLSTINKYPSWQPDWNSPLLKRAKGVYSELFGCSPVVEVIHAGLETGVLGSKYPGMDMISLGPTIRNPHSPDEMLLVSTINKVYQLTCGLLA